MLSSCLHVIHLLVDVLLYIITILKVLGLTSILVLVLNGIGLIFVLLWLGFNLVLIRLQPNLVFLRFRPIHVLLYLDHILSPLPLRLTPIIVLKL